MVLYRTLVVVAVVVCAITALAIYLTPLKHIAFVTPSMHEMDPADFYKDYQAHPDRYLIIDVRDVTKYVVSHAPGAISMPIVTLSDQYDTLPRSGKQIVLMCGDGRLAKVAYGYLEDYGFTNLIHITGGLNQWVAEDLPVETGNGSATSTATPTD